MLLLVLHDDRPGADNSKSNSTNNKIAEGEFGDDFTVAIRRRIDVCSAQWDQTEA